MSRHCHECKNLHVVYAKGRLRAVLPVRIVGFGPVELCQDGVMWLGMRLDVAPVTVDCCLVKLLSLVTVCGCVILTQLNSMHLIRS